MNMKNLITVLPLLAAQLFFMMPVPLHAATPDDSASGKVREVDWSISMYGFGATEASLPFWAVTNRHGIFPDAHGGLVTAGVSLDYSLPHSWYIDSKVSLAGSAVPGRFSGMADEIYVGVGWKKLRLDLGMKDRSQNLFNGLSLTGGNMIVTGNSRNFPGYNLSTDFINVPGTKGIFAFKANFADYKMLDNRYVKGAFLHNQSLSFKFAVHKRVDIILALEVWSQWSGTLPANGASRPEPVRQPGGFKDYLRIIFGSSGGSDATTSDQINALGNHLGRELVRVDWKADDFTMIFQHDIPFEDGSGMGFQNFPDGVNTVSFSFRGRDRWITDIVYEFVFTKWQSGKLHDRPPHEDELIKNPDKKYYVIGGRDNYFNNGEYRSGWTYYGNTIGLPLITPVAADENGIVLGVNNNRLTAHHVGIGGKIARVLPYRLMATYSRNFGTYSRPFDKRLNQLSLALETTLPRLGKRVPVSLTLGLYGDIGQLYSDNFGLTLRLSYSGKHIWTGAGTVGK